MIDCGFPIIRYEAGQPPEAWGRAHGESFRDAIRELADIRASLMFEKNPGLQGDVIDQLARQQWEATRQFDAPLTAELQGIADGASIAITDLVILNNYTDFRDIQVDDQGCSLAYVNNGGGPVVGQTWDMHGSAKRYCCCIELPEDDTRGRVVLFSAVGCVGMMGFNSHGGMLGVNNINTDGAVPSVMWPVIVRRVLDQSTHQQMIHWLTTSPKTSGHSYLIAVRDHAEMWEVAPGCHERVDRKLPGETGCMFHTNHCLGEQMIKREVAVSQNSTTHIRFELMKQKIGAVSTLDQMYELMNDHENYPKSICSNFQSDSQDPSITCGGAIGDLESGRVKMWRGDPLYDENFVAHDFQM